MTDCKHDSCLLISAPCKDDVYMSLKSSNTDDNRDNNEISVFLPPELSHGDTLKLNICIKCHVLLNMPPHTVNDWKNYIDEYTLESRLTEVFEDLRDPDYAVVDGYDIINIIDMDNRTIKFYTEYKFIFSLNDWTKSRSHADIHVFPQVEDSIPLETKYIIYQTVITTIDNVKIFHQYLVDQLRQKNITKDIVIIIIRKEPS